jgi:hypothetical protein
MTGYDPSMPGDIPRSRFLLALFIAIVADGLSIFAEAIMPLEWALDIVTALTLFAILGRRWQLLPALVAEAIPFVAAFPSWVLVVVAVQMSQRKPTPSTATTQPTDRKHVDNTAQG